jgi:hypothetical protein
MKLWNAWWDHELFDNLPKCPRLFTKPHLHRGKLCIIITPTPASVQKTRPMLYEYWVQKPVDKWRFVISQATSSMPLATAARGPHHHPTWYLHCLL